MSNARCPLDLDDCELVGVEGDDNNPWDLHWYPEDHPDPCFIYRDEGNHFGHDHGKVTGDGKTRADVVAS